MLSVLPYMRKSQLFIYIVIINALLIELFLKIPGGIYAGFLNLYFLNFFFGERPPKVIFLGTAAVIFLFGIYMKWRDCHYELEQALMMFLAVLITLRGALIATNTQP